MGDHLSVAGSMPRTIEALSNPTCQAAVQIAIDRERRSNGRNSARKA